MGVSYRAILVIGREFDSESEAAEFMAEKGIALPEPDSEQMEDGLGEYLYSVDVSDLKWTRYDYYTSWDGGCLGWSPNVREIDQFADQVRDMQRRWLELFGEQAEMIHGTQVC